VTNHRAVADKVATRLAARGAHAVVLVGSAARGDTHSGSDVDLVAIGDGPEYVLEMVDDGLVSISWKTVASVRERFDEPFTAGGIVPSWRKAVLLHDPDGLAGSLQRAALAWTWDRIGAQCDLAVARDLTGWSEEVFRLVGLRSAGDRQTAAVMRAWLAWSLPKTMAVHHRLMYDSENALWSMVASAMGADWARDFAIAFGLVAGDADLAALALFRAAAARVDRLLNATQRGVVTAAVAMSERVA
jgi:predicted nucleotidyltransferase